MACVHILTSVSEVKMIRQLNGLGSKLDEVILAMHKSNELMEKLTTQLEILTVPPDMIKMAQDKNKLLDAQHKRNVI
jgi:hypothetical protein